MRATTVTDFMVQERERGITIQSAAITCHGGHQINVIDTPGHIDFTAEVQRSLRVLDGGVVVFDGVAGVEPQSETVWHQADRYSVPRIAFVNKMDRTGANLDRTVEMMRKRLGAHPVVVQMPVGRESELHAVIDLVTMRQSGLDGDGTTDGEGAETSDIPVALRAEAERRREAMIEALADADDEIAVIYLEGEELTVDDLRAGLRRATIGGHAVPVLCGSALRNLGIQPLLDAIIAYLPSPLEVEPMIGHDPVDGEPVVCEPDAAAPLAALIFKISTDPYVGKLSFVRVYSGVLRRGESVLNPTARRTERIGRLVRMHADHREEGEEVYPATSAPSWASRRPPPARRSRPTTARWCWKRSPSGAVIEISVEPGSKGDQDKLAVALQRLTEEDPTLHLARTSAPPDDPRRHGRIAPGRDRRPPAPRVQVDVEVGAPQVAYCETITRPVEVEGRLVKQSGGRGQFAVVEVQFEPLPPGTGFVFENRVVGGSVPKEYIPAVEAGIREALVEGPLAKQPVVDLKATLVDGKYHEVDSSERAFHTAGSMALRDGVMRGGPVLLEPVMRVEVVAPQEYTGDVIGELSTRAGTVTGIEPHSSGAQSITAHVPLARMFGYATSLRSATQGRGTFNMQFSHYQQANGATRETWVRKTA